MQRAGRAVYFLTGLYFPIRTLGPWAFAAVSTVPLAIGLDAMRQLLLGRAPRAGCCRSASRRRSSASRSWSTWARPSGCSIARSARARRPARSSCATSRRLHGGDSRRAAAPDARRGAPRVPDRVELVRPDGVPRVRAGEAAGDVAHPARHVQGDRRRLDGGPEVRRPLRGNALYTYVLLLLVGLSWAIFEDREQYRMLKYVATAPDGPAWPTCWGARGRSSSLATLSARMVLGFGIVGAGDALRRHAASRCARDRRDGRGAAAGVAAVGLVLAGMALVFARQSMTMNEAHRARCSTSLCGVGVPARPAAARPPPGHAGAAHDAGGSRRRAASSACAASRRCWAAYGDVALAALFSSP